MLIASMLGTFPDEIKHIWSRIGTAEIATDPMGLELTDIFISLKPEHAPTAEQRKAIAEARQMADARLAEREILHASKMRGALEPEAREVLEQEYRRDRERIISDRDRKIEEARSGKR